MDKIIPINNDLEFEKAIEDITSIALDKDININNTDIGGTLTVSGTYKSLNTTASEEEFSYDIPIDITMGDNFDLESADIDIDDFHYDIKGDNILEVKIDLLLSNVIEKITPDIEEDIVKDIPILEEDNDLSDIYRKVDEIEDEEEIKTNSLFTKFLDSDDTYVTYKIYFVRENDTVESILDKYNITKEELSNYNDLDSIKINDKIVIPYKNEKA